METFCFQSRCQLWRQNVIMFSLLSFIFFTFYDLFGSQTLAGCGPYGLTFVLTDN